MASQLSVNGTAYAGISFSKSLDVSLDKIEVVSNRGLSRIAYIVKLGCFVFLETAF